MNLNVDFIRTAVSPGRCLPRCCRLRWTDLCEFLGRPARSKLTVDRLYRKKRPYFIVGRTLVVHFHTERGARFTILEACSRLHRQVEPGE